MVEKKKQNKKDKRKLIKGAGGFEKKEIEKQVIILRKKAGPRKVGWGGAGGEGDGGREGGREEGMEGGREEGREGGRDEKRIKEREERKS